MLLIGVMRVANTLVLYRCHHQIKFLTQNTGRYSSDTWYNYCCIILLTTSVTDVIISLLSTRF